MYRSEHDPSGRSTHDNGGRVVANLWHRPQTGMLRSRLMVTPLVGALICVVAAAALAAGASKSTLIRKLEGPDVITAPAKVPKKLSEAAQLPERVKAGQLPPRSGPT